MQKIVCKWLICGELCSAPIAESYNLLMLSMHIYMFIFYKHAYYLEAKMINSVKDSTTSL